MIKARVVAAIVSAGLATGALFGWLAVAAVAQPQEQRTVQVTGVECPAEDDCVLDYRDGSWYVTRVDH